MQPNQSQYPWPDGRNFLLIDGDRGRLASLHHQSHGRCRSKAKDKEEGKSDGLLQARRSHADFRAAPESQECRCLPVGLHLLHLRSAWTRGHTLASPPFHSNKIHVEFYIYDSSFSNDTKWMQFWNQVIPTSLESPAPPRNSTTHIDINQHQDRDRRQTSRGSRVPLTAMRPRSTLAAFSFVVSRSQAFNPVSSSSARCRRRVHLPSTRGRHRPPNTSLQLGSEGGDNVSVTGPIYVSTEGPEIKLFTKEGCTLCDKVKEVLEAIKEDNPHSLYAVDITDDDKKEWFDKYK